MNWLLVNFLVLTIIMIGGALFITWFYRTSRQWNAPVQDSKLAQLRRDVDKSLDLGASNKREINAAHDKADATSRETDHSNRAHKDALEYMLKEIRSVGAHINSLLEMRDDLHEVRAQALKTEQDLSSLACFMNASQKLPGFCPLHKVDCPLTPAEGTRVVSRADVQTNIPKEQKEKA
jgi:hypothetical protein